MNGVRRQGTPLLLRPYPADPSMGTAIPIALEGVMHFLRVPALCARHRPPDTIDPCATATLMMLVVYAFRNLPTVKEECGPDPAKFVQVMRAAAPLCCVIGDAAVDNLARQLVPIWSVRS